MKLPMPKDRPEEVALFRSEVIGALTRRDLARGELAAELEALSRKAFRPPDGVVTRRYSVATLERWYYAYREGGLEALRPESRRTGQAHALAPEQREVILDIRREHPSAAAELILRTLVADGRLDEGLVSAPTLRRLFLAHGVDRVPLRDGAGRKTRLRWQAERPGALWQGDVCHGPTLLIDGVKRPLRIHGLLDDASRYVPALEAHHTEREVDMIGLLVRAVRRHGPPDGMYLDNGSTYRGEILRVACERLGVTLLHPKPGDAEARGKMERFWRTLRQGCLDFLGPVASLHDVNVRLWAFLDQHYHRAPHGGLFGKAPADVWDASEADRKVDALTEDMLRRALTVLERRRVRRDNTLSLDGLEWELDQGFLAGRLVTVGRSYLDPADPPWVEYEDKRLPLHLVDPVKNARRERPPRREPASGSEPEAPRPSVPFDPPGALLDCAVGRKPRSQEKSS